VRERDDLQIVVALAVNQEEGKVVEGKASHRSSRATDHAPDQGAFRNQVDDVLNFM